MRKKNVLLKKKAPRIRCEAQKRKESPGQGDPGDSLVLW